MRGHGFTHYLSDCTIRRESSGLASLGKMGKIHCNLLRVRPKMMAGVKLPTRAPMLRIDYTFVARGFDNRSQPSSALRTHVEPSDAGIHEFTGTQGISCDASIGLHGVARLVGAPDGNWQAWCNAGRCSANIRATEDQASGVVRIGDSVRQAVQFSCWPTASRRRLSRSPSQEALSRPPSRPRIIECVTDFTIVSFAVQFDRFLPLTATMSAINFVVTCERRSLSF